MRCVMQSCATAVLQRSDSLYFVRMEIRTKPGQKESNSLHKTHFGKFKVKPDDKFKCATRLFLGLVTQTHLHAQNKPHTNHAKCVMPGIMD